MIDHKDSLSRWLCPAGRSMQIAVAFIQRAWWAGRRAVVRPPLRLAGRGSARGGYAPGVAPDLLAGRFEGAMASAPAAADARGLPCAGACLGAAASSGAGGARLSPVPGRLGSSRRWRSG